MEGSPLLIGTKSYSKMDEFEKVLHRYPEIQLVRPYDIGITLDVQNISTSNLKENAIHRADRYMHESGMDTIATAGALYLDALDGKPGIGTNQWVSQHGTTDSDKITFLLEELEGNKQRTGTWKEVAALVTKEGERIYATYEEKGTVITDIPTRIVRDFWLQSIWILEGTKKPFIELSRDEQLTSGAFYCAVDEVITTWRKKQS